MLLTKFLPAMALSAATLLAGNAYAFTSHISTRHTTPSAHMLTTPPPQAQSTHVKTKLLEQYSKWKGTRYHFGGHSRYGIDCSALMQEIFQGSMRMNLPRTTGEQIHNGFRITQHELKPGDLVFFQTTPGTRHVGVYVGDNEFIHASKRAGVTVSSLDNDYWQAHYETARRIMG